jgi:hypothetical protein
MPYLEYLFCEDCGNYARLDIDPKATIRAYNRDGRTSSFLNQATIIWDYLIYSCPMCNREYKYTYRDVEAKVREYFSSFSSEFKEYFSKIDSENTEELPPEYIEPTFNSITIDRVKKLYAHKE